MFEIFKIGFLSVTFLDVIDIFIVTVIFYKLFKVIRGTIASQIFIGLIIVLFLSFLAQAANFKALGWLLKLISDIWVIAFIILFQPEIRRLLTIVGRSQFFRPYVKGIGQTVPEIVTDAAFEMAQVQHGALIVLVKGTGIRGVVETGEEINSKVNKNLIKTIFFPRTALHDGAMIIKGDIIEAARCTLPLSTETVINGIPLGMRHKAGLGITEQTDVICVIVSEETGGISIAHNGELKRGLSRDSLRSYLANNLSDSKTKGLRGFKGLFEQFGKKK